MIYITALIFYCLILINHQMKKKKKWKLYLLYPILTICTIMLLIIGYKLNQSTVTLTENGIYKTLHIPIKNKFIDINVNLAGAADQPKFESDFIQGPIVSYTNNETLQVAWYNAGKNHEKIYDANIKSFSIHTEDEKHDFILPEIDTPPTVIKTTPNKVAFISDVHGDFQYMNNVLFNLNVIDSLGNWNFDTNHLVIAGDMVDRGTSVDQVLWKIVLLSEQAKQAGGMVHYLIGNHEQYILKGNFSRVHPKNLYATQQMMPFAKAYSNNTYLGKWLRTRPVLLKIGNTLVTHGGVSPETVVKKYTVQQINQAMWDYWNEKPIEEDLKEIILGKTGVTQYRGYIRANDEVKKASKNQVQQVLEYYDASRVIVGHTNVDSITPIFEGKVYDINAIETSPQALLLENGKPKVINIGLVKEEKTYKTYHRDFSLSKANDLKLIALTINSAIKLSMIPHPY
ncbi:hypothetical protein GBO31_22095 [Aquimarina litoralis]|nr:hypothetical protein [Aquimarina litoralis]